MDIEGQELGAVGSSSAFGDCPTWSPDGKQFAFAACLDRKWRVVVGKKSSEPCDEIAGITWAGDVGGLWYGSRQGDEIAWRKFVLERVCIFSLAPRSTGR